MATPTELAKKNADLSNKIEMTERMLAGTGLNSLSKEDALVMEEKKPLLADTCSSKKKKSMRNYINATEGLLASKKEEGKTEVSSSLDEDLRFLSGDRQKEEDNMPFIETNEKAQVLNDGKILNKLDKIIELLKGSDR